MKKELIKAYCLALTRCNMPGAHAEAVLHDFANYCKNVQIEEGGLECAHLFALAESRNCGITAIKHAAHCVIGIMARTGKKSAVLEKQLYGDNWPEVEIMATDYLRGRKA